MPLRPPFPLAMLVLAAMGMVREGAAADPEKGKVPAAPFAQQAAPFLAKYCNNCHGGEKPKGDLNLTSFADEASVLRARKVWKRVGEQIEGGDMPPEDKPQPSEGESAAFLKWVETTLKSVDCGQQIDPGRVTIRRLNRSEYNNTIRDLTGIDFHAADDFPSDDVGYGFDNIGDVLTLPPILFERYLDAAEKIAEQAIVVVGPNGPRAEAKTYEMEDLPNSAGGSTFADSGRILASQGAISIEHDFLRDAEYRIRIRAFGQQAGPEPTRMGLLIDGKTLRTFEIKGDSGKPNVVEYVAKLKHGRRKVSISFLNDYYNASNPDPKQRDRNLVIDWVELEGPLATKNAPLPESHRRIIFKTPTKGNRDEVTREVVERFARRAFRRPVTPGELARLVKFVDLAQQNGDPFERGIQVAVEAILVSPQFLFRVELDQRPPQRRRGESSPPPPPPVPINEFELASRLSYFLWSSMPDDELYHLALNNKLREGNTLEKQVARMLRDPKARALVDNFADQWLQIRNLKTVNPDKARFPTFDENLRTAMQTETELFFEWIIKNDRPVLDLIDADYTFVNERLAKHYGLPNVTGDGFRKVSLKGTPRGGILTQASILTVTSNPTRTSPVKRGKWILEQILGTPPPPPPGDVPELDKDTKLTGTLRQKMEQHRVNPACASCHAKMDPIGFGFENFDAIGSWRDKDGDQAVDASGELPNGQTFRGPVELKNLFKKRDKDFVRCLAEKMLTYALGRGVEYYDACAIDAIVDGTVNQDYRFSRLVLEIVKSEPFQKRKGGRG